MPTIGDKTVRAMMPILMGAVFVLTAETAMDSLASLARATPHVGDILAFTATPPISQFQIAQFQVPQSQISEMQALENSRFVVRRMDASGCVLDLGAIRQTGGSLVVESEVEAAEPGFRVHWAGARTTAGAGNCGNNADLIVSAQELKIMALGAVGYADRDFASLPVTEVAN